MRIRQIPLRSSEKHFLYNAHKSNANSRRRNFLKVLRNIYHTESNYHTYFIKYIINICLWAAEIRLFLRFYSETYDFSAYINFYAKILVHFLRLNYIFSVRTERRGCYIYKNINNTH